MALTEHSLRKVPVIADVLEYQLDRHHDLHAAADTPARRHLQIPIALPLDIPTL
ncbi:hypothetical protein [Rhodococcus qingshengii]|uniref:hypothetical protein n=1 Tax=Rhodococcus qingshengii TaxID=334542 RepID=UPI001BE9F28C|nr:hypothetical protein [Rhodococcus qingshengii]MBT2271632.1 hypothetical protein [Rhodococcus qingshengii]